MVRAPCCVKEGLKKGRWTDEEDSILTRYIQAHGEGSWRSVPKSAGLQRCGKSCRLRWINYLRPDLKRGNITSEEEAVILRLHASMGNRWSLIAGHLPGRTDNEIKNYWNSHLSRKILTYPNALEAKFTELDPSLVGSAEITAKRKLRRGRSRHRASNKSASLRLTDTNSSRSVLESEELELMGNEKPMQPVEEKESFAITDYMIDEGEDNSPSLNADESLIFSSAHKPSYFNEELSEVLCSLHDSLNLKVEETEVNFSTHNMTAPSTDPKKVSKDGNESKSLSLSSAGDAWADWDWKGLVNGHHKLIDEDEMLSMLWDGDDGSHFKCSNQ